MPRRAAFTFFLAVTLILSTPGQPQATGSVPPSSVHGKSFLMKTDGTPPAFVGGPRGT
jgi:hypothetical protein